MWPTLVDEATAFCWTRLEGPELPSEARALSEVLVFLEQMPDDDRTAAAAARVVKRLSGASSWRTDPDDPGYGLSPLGAAPLADSRWRGLFPTEVLAAHLDRLQRDQPADGGSPITWEPPSEQPSGVARGHDPRRLAHAGFVRAIERTGLTHSDRCFLVQLVHLGTPISKSSRKGAERSGECTEKARGTKSAN